MHQAGPRLTDRCSADIGKYISIDCEMVGVGPTPKTARERNSALARVSVVNYHGVQIYDSYVIPKEEVTDWRTAVSGISPDLMENARSFEEVQRDVAGIMLGRILVGHDVMKDLNVLMLGHPRVDLRDTSRHEPYRALAGGSSPGLKMLAANLLGVDIQGGAHSSVEDARACMLLYRRDKDLFETKHAQHMSVKAAETAAAVEAAEKKAQEGDTIIKKKKNRLSKKRKN
jgi:RNA exonuclease 4